MTATMQLSEPDLRTGTELFHARLLEIIEAEPEITDIHGAFEMYAMRKYSLGNSAGNHVVGASNDLGIDFYSQRDRVYHVGQCKIPEDDWLEANPTKPKLFGSQALSDTKDALRYLFGTSTLKPHEQVKRLYALVHADVKEPEFSFTFYIIIFGRLNPRARDEVSEIQGQYSQKGLSIVLVEMDSLVSEFLVGAGHTSENIQFDVHFLKDQVLRAPNYCYFLASSGDIFRELSLNSAGDCSTSTLDTRYEILQ
jgi:hypothetical protein